MNAITSKPANLFRVSWTSCLLGALGLLLASCSGSSSTPVDARAAGPFEVLGVQPDGKASIFLNETVRWVFSHEVDLDTADFNSVAFVASDSRGNLLQEQVTGVFRVGVDSKGDPDPRVLEFEPRLATNNTYDDGGFKSSRIYTIKILTEAQSQQPVLRDTWGNPVDPTSAHLAMSLRTVSASTPRGLFQDSKKGGPRVRFLNVGPRSGDRVSLNLLGTVPVEVRIDFDQPVDPSDQNVPVSQDSHPLRAALRKKGKVFLEYDDPVLGKNQWIRAQVELAVNDRRGARVILRPEGVLPNNATVRVIVEADFRDVSGESNAKEPRYNRVVGTFATQEAFGPQFDALMMSFERDDLLDREAAFLDPVAEIKGGLLRASFDFEGNPTTLDWAPTSRELNLNTNFAVVQPRNGPSTKVSGGVFHFRDIEIGSQIRVQGYGSNPLVFLANGTVRIDGHVLVDGTDGASASSGSPISNARPLGGTGYCGGGSGGMGSNSTSWGAKGQSGFGPGGIQGGGGEGGKIACGSSQDLVASGGGGGSMATQGDPDFLSVGVQVKGRGGNGNIASSVGGKPGRTVFEDAQSENDFWGRLVDERNEVVLGELATPMGGSGGGGGGGMVTDTKCTPKAFSRLRAGGGGGAGGGVLIIKALGPIIVGPSGRISADGGRGGGGDWAGSSLLGGGGGGGSGGMVVLMSATRIDLHTHQGTYAKRDYNFSVTADGNISRVESYGTRRRQKYPPTADKPNSGGFGGMGLIQIQAPPGNDSDKTGSILDDNIRIIDKARVLTGSSKTAYLFRGDIRPDPQLLSVPYGRYSSAELHWQTTGASVRRESSRPGTAGARVVDRRLGRSGPQWFFEGLVNQSSIGGDGYLESARNGAGMGTAVRLSGGKTRVAILKAESRGAEYYGSPAHVIHVADGTLPDPLKGGWSYANYRARLFDNKDRMLAEHLIVSNGADRLLLDAGLSTLPKGLARVEISTRFLRVETRGREGLGAYYGRQEGKNLKFYPKANIQIGFAFHKDPAKPKLSGNQDLDRFPQEIGTFLYGLDLDDPGTMEVLRKRHYPFAKVRIRFNLNYTPDHPDTRAGPNPVHAGMDLPGIRYLMLPYKF